MESTRAVPPSMQWRCEWRRGSVVMSSGQLLIGRKSRSSCRSVPDMEVPSEIASCDR